MKAQQRIFFDFLRFCIGPTLSFNVIYILSHLYRHVFTEGIGLRQLHDYYFVVNDFCKVKETFSNHPVPLSKEGSTFSPSPSSSGSRDVAGDAIALPEFLYRQRSLCPQGAADDCLTQQSCDYLSAGALQRELKHLGLWKFAGAVMYVLHEVFGLEEEKMIAPMNEKEGRFVKHYPSEAICEPLFRTWFFWKAWHKG